MGGTGAQQCAFLLQLRGGAQQCPRLLGRRSTSASHGTTESLPFTLRRAAHDLETKRCLCGTWKNTVLYQKKEIPANLLE